MSSVVVLNDDDSNADEDDDSDQSITSSPASLERTRAALNEPDIDGWWS